MLVPPGDPAALAAAIGAVAGDGERRRMMGEAARARFGALFEGMAWARRLRALYDEVLAEQPAAR